ncbi:3-beta-hydroxysteroid sulfotransferase-like [Ctenodactylus gundi]
MWLEGIPFPRDNSNEGRKEVRNKFVVKDEDTIVLSYPKSGIRFPKENYNYEVLKEVHDKFSLKDEDTVILTYPKSGTNWLIEILSLINSKGDPKWVQSVPTWKRSPWVETVPGYDKLKDVKGPRLITSHLPIHLFPKSWFTSKAKVIYVIRNPKDVLVSGYFFFPKMKLAKTSESLEEYFQRFIQGHVIYGSWFSHTRGWMSMRERENVLLLSYEELKKDPRSSVEKICQFLGKRLEPDQIDSIVKNSSFKAMKNNSMSNFSLLCETNSTPNTPLTRKVLQSQASPTLIACQNDDP